MFGVGRGFSFRRPTEGTVNPGKGRVGTGSCTVYLQFTVAGWSKVLEGSRIRRVVGTRLRPW